MEIRAVDPHAMKDDADAARQGNDRLLPAAPPGDLRGPRLQGAPSLHASKQHLRGLIDPHHCASPFRDPSHPVDLAELVLARCETEVRADGTGTSEASGQIDGSSEGERDERSDTRHCHEATADGIFASKADKQVIKLSEPLSECSANDQERLHDHHQFGIAGEFANPSFEVSSCDLAEVISNVTKEPSNFILQVKEFRPEQLTRSEDRPKALA